MKFYMYSDEGNALVAEAVASMQGLVREEGVYTSFGLLQQVARAHMREIARKGHGEVYDTEPRVTIADALDTMLAEATGQECHEFDWRLGR